ncbi:MAG: hypothetical protein H6711_19830 [Myxococcales bacterium]|nr:hypothetical protein [Myxococcales bacterium]
MDAASLPSHASLSLTSARALGRGLVLALVLGLAPACGDDKMGDESEGSTAASDPSGGGTTSAGTSGTTGGGTTEGGTTGGGDGSLAQLCVDTINEYRASLGLPAYQRWTDGEACADGEAESDSKTNTPHGAFPSCGEFAQNECPGWPSSDPEGSLLGCLDLMWSEGPGADFAKHGHYINMSSEMYTKVACGFYTTASGDLWAVQNFK